jgi:signal transduction histidine kinase
LAIARLIVHAHGGEIELMNKPTSGLHASIMLP